MLVKFCVGGNGGSGRLGNDAIVSSDHPVYVVDGDGSSTHLTGIVQISSSGSHVCALNNSGNVYCWGDGSSGLLGNDASTNKDHPVHVVETDGDPTSMLSDVVQIGSGHSHTCVIKSSGKIFCWGKGQTGPLGDNDLTDHFVDHPISVVTSASSNATYKTGQDIICKTDANGVETCDFPPPPPVLHRVNLRKMVELPFPLNLTLVNLSLLFHFIVTNTARKA